MTTVRTSAPRVRVGEIRCYERPVRLRMPFRFGVATMTEGIEAFLHVRVTREDGREAWGIAAEQLAAWFDKNLALTHEDNFVQLRTSLSIARDLYTSERRPRSAFARFAECYRAQIEACAVRDLNPLIAGYGPALLDRAVLDALCRLHGVSFYEAIRANLPGIAPVELLPEFRGVDVDAFLATLTPADWIDARHTVGMVDPITSADQTGAARVGDGLPETLEEVVTTYRHRYYKLKLGGDVTRDLARLAAIAVVLDGIAEPYRVTLDGNEQYEDVDGITELWNALEQTPALRRMVDSILFIEQPIARQRALERDVARLSARRPVIIDESDADLDAFPRARERGYLGVSSKTCKGLYKSLINRARCALWNRKLGGDRYFMSAEDLTTQPGVSVQQDLALVSLLGLTHVERNGHHYVNGMAAVPAAEQQRFLDAHPDLYTRSHGAVRLRIEGGRLAIGSLACPGFAVGAEPDWASMRETSRTVPPFPPTTTR